MKFVINIEPVPQARHRSTIRNGRIHTYEDNEMKFYKRNIAYLVKPQTDTCWANCALKLTATFYITPPKYISKVKKNQKALEDETMSVFVKPDLDNYEKALMDAINGICYKDDGQVAKKNAEKFYSYRPRIEFELEQII
ncbi:MAG: RusA family crossover junction endodeoxyribonuclease [Lactococcus lactis]|nr:RusA family crossover junction endodeoxyribonuclease [Lactococcus lactis]MDN5446292.1 RusA family crossover junction endodeoxyribonuclease [Lactococcus lactis]